MDNLTELIENLQAESLGSDESVIVNLSFGSLDQFMTFTDYMNRVFAEVENWGGKRGYMKKGPGVIDQSPSGQVSSFMVYSPDESYIEGFAMDMRSIGQDGVAFLKYTCPDPKRASEVLALLAENERLVKAVQSAEYQKCKKPESANSASAKAHFIQTKDEAVPCESRVSPISEDVIGWFNGRGWALYEVAPEIEEMPDLIAANGPAAELKKGVSYHVLPVIEDSSSPEAMEAAVKRLIDKGQTPVYDDMNGTRLDVDGIMLDSGVVFIYPYESDRRMRVPYFNLERTITQVITPCEV